jgi:hypothetical protein
MASFKHPVLLVYAYKTDCVDHDTHIAGGCGEHYSYTISMDT